MNDALRVTVFVVIDDVMRGRMSGWVYSTTNRRKERARIARALTAAFAQ